MSFCLSFSPKNFTRIGITGLLFSSLFAKAQSPFKGFENLFTTPKSYIINYTKTPPVIDGNINDEAWQEAQWTEEFTDIEGDLKPKPSLPTNVKMLWDDNYIYIAAKVMEPNVWATLKQHDEVVFHDNDFEVFIDPGNTTQKYFELEFNALNTVFDLFLNKPYRNGGSALINWNAEGLRSAVKIQGTINAPTDTDNGWTVEMAIPFKAISIGDNIQVPQDGTLWRINFSRVEWDTNISNGKYIKKTDDKGNNLPEHNWVWSPQGVINMHYPERWGYLQFNKSAQDVSFVLPYSEKQKQYLWLIYYREKQWFAAHQSYNPALKDFDLGEAVTIDGQENLLKIEATGRQFIAYISDKNLHVTWLIDQDGATSQISIPNHE